MADWQSLYPYESRYLSIHGQKMHYVDEGQGDTLLFVHGNPTWSFYWHPLINQLKASYRCAAVDHIGCGLSDKPADYAYTLSTHIANLTQLVEELDLNNVTLLAHDWGGAIGLGTVLNHADRFSRIVLFNTGAFPPPFIPFRIRVCRWPMFGSLALQGMNAFSRAALSMATEKPDKMTDEVKAGLLAPYDSWGNRKAVYSFVRDIPTSPRHPTWKVLEDIERDLPTLSDKSIQLIWGMRDWCFRPACLEQFESIWPNASVLRIDNAGHYVVLDADERIVPALQTFLTEHPIEEQTSVS